MFNSKHKILIVCASIAHSQVIAEHLKQMGRMDDAGIIVCADRTDDTVRAALLDFAAMTSFKIDLPDVDEEPHHIFCEGDVINPNRFQSTSRKWKAEWG